MKDPQIRIHIRTLLPSRNIGVPVDWSLIISSPCFGQVEEPFLGQGIELELGVHQILSELQKSHGQEVKLTVGIVEAGWLGHSGIQD